LPSPPLSPSPSSFAFFFFLLFAFLLFATQLQEAFSLDDTVFEVIKKHVPKNGVVVELGSGPGTKKLVEHYTVYSVEHDLSWVNHVKESRYIHSPIVPLKQVEFPDTTGWYDPQVLRKKLPSKYDFLLVDGPPSFYGRGGLLAHLELFNTDVPILIDDTNREPERKLLDLLSKKLNRRYELIKYGGKECGLILKA